MRELAQQSGLETEDSRLFFLPPPHTGRIGVGIGGAHSDIPPPTAYYEGVPLV